MVTLKHVISPLDGSEQAEAALQLLRFLPIQRLTLIQVCEEPSAAPDEAQRYLDDVVQRMGPDCPEVETRVVTGGAAEEIVAAAAGADLIVMSTRGAGGGGRLLFGSVADRVARHAPAPALLLRGGRSPVNPAALERIVVPLDGSPAAERALPLATALADSLSSTLHLVTIDESAEAGAEPSAAQSSAYLEQLGALANSAERETTTEQRAGDPAGELLGLVGPGDLLVMTTHGQGAARRWQIGHVAEKMLRQAAAPVVLVRADTP